MAEGRRKSAKGQPRTGAAARSFSIPLTTTLPQLLEGGSDHAFRQLIYDIAHLSELVADARRHLAAQLGLTPPLYNILMVVAEYGGAGGITVVDASLHLHVTAAFVTTQVNQLVERSLIAKSPNPEDGRSVILTLTALGKREVLRVSEDIRKINDDFFAGLDRVSFRVLTTAVAQLIKSGELVVLKVIGRGEALPDYARRAITKRIATDRTGK